VLYRSRNLRTSGDRIMTRKDYQLIADVIKATAANRPATPQGWTPTLRALALSLSVELKKDNPNFKPEYFMKACGI